MATELTPTRDNPETEHSGRTALFLIGTRPELIKMAPILWKLPTSLRAVVVFTGQHTDLVDELAPTLGVTPDIRLQVMRPGQSLSDLTARLLQEIDRVIAAVAPDVVVAQGDTATVLAASMAAFFRRVPFAHVEAGLRSGNLAAPFPEEANRRLAGLTTSIHLAPTAKAVAALLAEGVPAERVHLVGNTVVDAVRRTAAQLPVVAAAGRRRILLTTHRRESFGAPLQRVLEAVRIIAAERPDVDIIWPVHPNPAVREASRALADVDNVQLVEPLNYVDLVEVLRGATLVLTDSGGLQEEAPSLEVPVLVLRDSTERPEGVEAGVARLVGTDTEVIVRETLRLLDDADAHDAMRGAQSPYGDGESGARIAGLLARPHPSIFDTATSTDTSSSASITTTNGTHRPAMEHARSAAEHEAAPTTSTKVGKPLAA